MTKVDDKKEKESMIGELVCSVIEGSPIMMGTVIAFYPKGTLSSKVTNLTSNDMPSYCIQCDIYNIAWADGFVSAADEGAMWAYTQLYKQVCKHDEKELNSHLLRSAYRWTKPV